MRGPGSRHLASWSADGTRKTDAHRSNLVAQLGAALRSGPYSNGFRSFSGRKLRGLMVGDERDRNKIDLLRTCIDSAHGTGVVESR